MNLDSRRYSKLLTVYNRLCSLRDDFEDKRDISLSYGNGTCYERLGCALASLQTILQEVE